MESPEYRQLRMRAVDKVQEENGVPALLLFDASDAFIEHDGPENHYRPYLMLHGRPAGVKAELPFQVSTLQYEGSTDRRLIMYRYDFTRENLQELCSKGLFETGFEPPSQVRTSRYELPCEISYAAFPPMAGEPNPENPPVVYASLQPGSLHCDDETSGYMISSYFDAVPVRSVQAEMDAPGLDLEAIRSRESVEFASSDIKLASLPEPKGFRPLPEVDELFTVSDEPAYRPSDIAYDESELPPEPVAGIDSDDMLSSAPASWEQDDPCDGADSVADGLADAASGFEPDEPLVPADADGLEPLPEPELVDEPAVRDTESEDARVRAQAKKRMQQDAVNDAAEFAAAEDAAKAPKPVQSQPSRRRVDDMVVDGADAPNMGPEYM